MRRRPGPRARDPIAGALALLLCAACSGATSTGDDPLGSRPDEPAAPGPGPSGPAAPDPGPILKGSLREHPAGAAWLVQAGAEPRRVDLGLAEATGHTIVDLSDTWVPVIFGDKTAGRDDASQNRFAARYRDLADDRTDADGDPLRPHEHNFLELYGIPPTLSVIRDEWQRVEDEVQTCLDESSYDPAVFRRFTGTIAFAKAGRSRVKKARWAKGSLESRMRKAKLAPTDFAAAAADPRTKNAYQAWRELQDAVDVVVHAQKRFRCEKLFASDGGRGRFIEGDFDPATHQALAAFEKKHAIMGWGHFKPDNLEVLAQSAVESTHARLLRVVRERIVSAAGIVEDGSAAAARPDFRWKDRSGAEHQLRDLVGEAAQAGFDALDLSTPERARASLDMLAGLSPEPFSPLLVAIKLPPRPEYYAAHMELDAVIDRGDVWYDYPFDELGNPIPQPRERVPRLTIYATYLDQKIPLVHWRTTIGSWRSEQLDGKEWYAYKNSDVGARVWKDIMAGPSWIPPASTPTRTLVKRKYKDGRLRTLVNYDETGPGYQSAYGLVAAYHIRQVPKSNGTVVELDNQIRTHGSVDYMSILRRYSHGCHRLYNMNAVRLFSFVLLHRDYVRHGQTQIGFARAFEHEGASYRIALDTRGYNYELTPPIPVVVTEGRIRGKRRSPVEEYLPKPGVIYDDALVETPTSDAATAVPLPVPLPPG